MARAREIAGLEPGTRFRHAAGAAVEVRTEEVFSFREAVLDVADIERVHDMRVATRRLRAAMEVFAACFPKSAHRDALDEVKALADALGERRDPDVAIDLLEQAMAGFSVEDRPGVSGLVAELRGKQEEGNEQLAAALARLDESDLRLRLLTLAAEAAR